MRRDPLCYKLFQQSPSLLFELIRDRPANAADYRFDSVAVKEPKFEIDSVFLPPESDEPGIVYFCEIQFQIVTLLLMYKFSTLSRAEVRAMIGLNLSEEPRAIREAKEEGREEQAIALITRQLTRRFQQELSEEVRSQLANLPLFPFSKISAKLY